MGLVSYQRGSKADATEEGLPVSTSGTAVPKKKWSNLLPLFVALVVIAEIAFLGRLDMAKNAAMVDTLTDLFYPPRKVVEVDNLGIGVLGNDRNPESDSCEEYLQREDAVTYSRDFTKEPILVFGAEKVRLISNYYLHFSFLFMFSYDIVHGIILVVAFSFLEKL